MDYEEKCNEVVELSQELRALKIEHQQLRLRLQVAAASTNQGRVPSALSMPAAGSHQFGAIPVQVLPEDPRPAELITFFTWLAQNVNLSCEEMLDVGVAVSVAGRTANLHRMVQWPLLCSPTGIGQLRFSVPWDHAGAIRQVLQLMKTGNPATVDFRLLAAHWDLVPGDLKTDLRAHPEPVVLFAHRGSTAAALVSSWPTRSALDSFRALHGCDGEELPTVGERVSVEYEGTWYTGMLDSVDAAGRAIVRCDVDPAGVFTIAPLHRLRRLHQAERSSADVRPEGSLPSQEQNGGSSIGSDSIPGSPKKVVSGACLRTKEVAKVGPRSLPALCPRHRRTRSAM